MTHMNWIIQTQKYFDKMLDLWDFFMFRPRRTNLRPQVLIQWAKKEISAKFFWVQRAMKGKLESADTVSLKGNVWKFFLSSAEQGKGS